MTDSVIHALKCTNEKRHILREIEYNRQKGLVDLKQILHEQEIMPSCRGGRMRPRITRTESQYDIERHQEDQNFHDGSGHF